MKTPGRFAYGRLRAAAWCGCCSDRVGNPLEWNDVDKALVVQAIQAPMVSVVLVRGSC